MHGIVIVGAGARRKKGVCWCEQLSSSTADG